MLHLAAALLAIQVTVRVDSTPPDSTGKRKKEVSVEATFGPSQSGKQRDARRIPVTPEHLRTAFSDARARELLLAGRAARLAQDSAIRYYDAMTYQRISAGIGITKLGRDRLAFRHESAARVRWQRGVGAWVELKGERAVVPVAPEEAQHEAQSEMGDDMMSPIPYYPGKEPLVVFDENATGATQVNERELVHPLLEGAEAYYTYETGDSLRFRLPDGFVVRLRELRVRPREPKWNVVVGSIWFDVSSGQVVRAAYRLAVPMDIWTVAKQDDPHAMDDVPLLVKPMLSPMRAEVKAIAIEYGLYGGHYWLPRLRSVDGTAQVSFMRVPFRMDQRFTYASVNGRDSLPPIPVVQRPDLDSLPEAERERVRDSMRVARRAVRDSIERGLRTRSGCDTSAFTTRIFTRFGDARVPVAYQVPCDRASLATSAELPPSIYDPGEEVFGSTERDALIAEALSLGAQARFGPQPPVVRYGLELTRYNRVEGLSLGAALDEQFGAGYTGELVGRIGTADREPNVSLKLGRSNGTRTVYVRGYRELVSANDWGSPLSFGSSVSAFLFGRDEGFYYRATGVEIGGNVDAGGHMQWRIFGEGQRTATPRTDFSLSRASFAPNIIAWQDRYAGIGFRLSGSHGLDPHGFRAYGDVRLEAAAADSGYGRGAAELTLSDGLGRRFVGALTLSGGSSIGSLPPQRRWYLGGTQTVRGQYADTAQAGNAYWLGRAELGADYGIARPSIFADIGWAGDRRYMDRVGRPLSGAGVGVSMLDGLVRADLARGIHPRERWRLDLSLEARF